MVFKVIGHGVFWTGNSKFKKMIDIQDDFPTPGKVFGEVLTHRIKIITNILSFNRNSRISFQWIWIYGDDPSGLPAHSIKSGKNVSFWEFCLNTFEDFFYFY